MRTETSNYVVRIYFISSVASWRCNKASCPLHPAPVFLDTVQRHPWVFLTSDSRLFVLLSVRQKKEKGKKRRNQRGREYFLMVRWNTFIIYNNPPPLFGSCLLTQCEKWSSETDGHHVDLIYYDFLFSDGQGLLLCSVTHLKTKTKKKERHQTFSVSLSGRMCELKTQTRGTTGRRHRYSIFAQQTNKWRHSSRSPSD